MASYPVQLFSTLTTTSAAISLSGSSAIIYVVSQSRNKFKTTLNRLLLCLCIGDIILSIAFIFTKSIVKSDDKFNADGVLIYSLPVANNQAACNVQGFFFVLGGILSPFYNCALCVYYLCVIKFNYSNTKIKKKIEPYLHAVPWTWASFCAVYALASKSINANRTVCWIEPSPINCKNPAAGVDCERGENAVELRMIFQTGPLMAIFFAICGMMTILYLTVWKQQRKMKRYDHRAAASMAGRRNEASMIVGRQSTISAGGLLRQNVTNSRKVLNQALAYVGAYLFSYTLTIINQFIFIGSGKYNLTILVISCVFYPLHGFFNFMVFIYPRVTRQMRGNEDMNVLQALLAAVQCKPIPPRRKRNSSSGASTVGGGGVNKAPRKISGLGGTPSSYAGRYSSVIATRSGQRSVPAAASSLVESDMSADDLNTMATLKASPKKKTTFADKSITTDCDLNSSIYSIGEEGDKDVESLPEESNVLGGEQADGVDNIDTTTRVCHSRRKPSILRKASFLANYSPIDEEIEEEKDIEILPEGSDVSRGEQIVDGRSDTYNTIDGSAALELLSVDDTHASVEGGKAEAENDADSWRDESGLLEGEQGDAIDNDNNDEETGFSSSQN